jgi:cell division protein FtsN
MSRNTGNKSAAPRKGGGSPLLTGLLIGMVIGVGLAAGLAWYLMKSPSPFVQNEQVIVQPPAAKTATPTGATTPAATPPATAAAVGEGKPRFEFYKVLTDKTDAAGASGKPVDKTATVKAPVEPGKPASASEPQFLQAGSFPSADDAEKLKAKLALLGLEANIQIAAIPDKGVWHRVRVGPYKNADEMNKARALMKQNGVDATPTRAQ